MATTFRVASFNVENLFSRASVLNLQDETVSNDALQKIDKLRNALRKEAYSNQDKEQILGLYGELKDYVLIREHRGKLLKKSGGKLQVVAEGVHSWDGDIEFKRAKISKMGRNNTAKVIKEAKADVVCIVEAENRPMLCAFNSELLAKQRFDYVMLIDGNDDRGIDVGLLTRLPIVSLRSHVYDRDNQGIIFSRDCLEVHLELSDGRSLVILCNHLKSKGYGSAADSQEKRRRQTQRLADILAAYDLTRDLVIVAGDFNDTPDSGALAPILGVQNLHDVLEVQFGNQPSKRGTYSYQNKLQQIDYILVSEPLKKALQSAGVERRGIFELKKVTDGAETEFKTVTSLSNTASDHGAVWAEFGL